MWSAAASAIWLLCRRPALVGILLLMDLLTPAQTLPAVEHFFSIVLDPPYKLVTSHMCCQLAFAAVMYPRVILLQMQWLLLTHVTGQLGELTVVFRLLFIPGNCRFPL
jgi:hypothetical protein